MTPSPIEHLWIPLVVNIIIDAYGLDGGKSAPRRCGCGNTVSLRSELITTLHFAFDKGAEDCVTEMTAELMQAMPTAGHA